MVSYQDAVDRLRSGEIRLSPLTFELRQVERPLGRGKYADAVVRAWWRDRAYDFDVEYKPYSTPKMLRQAVDQVRDRS